MLKHIRTLLGISNPNTPAWPALITANHAMSNQPDPDEHLTNDFRARIPSVDSLITSPEFTTLVRSYGRDAVLLAIRDRLNVIRNSSNRAGSARGSLEVDRLADNCSEDLDRLFWHGPREVINATGVIIHTNLGRAPMSKYALLAAGATAGYMDLEYDLETGERGSRQDHLRKLIQLATGAESGIAVNNNAAATLLVLAALAGGGKEVIVSRSEAVEIGGGFRIPDVMAQSGAKLVEVGTTNRTYARDYADAITAHTAAILKVHRSNFAITGFTHDASIEQLSDIGKRRGVLVLHDVGSGALLDTTKYGLGREPMVQDSLNAGANVVMFSGDKLLGGPQAGIVVGDASVIKRVESHPLARAMRVDKMTIAALRETLGDYVKGDAESVIPVWQMIATPLDTLKHRAETWLSAGGHGRVVEGYSVIGGGSAPDQKLPTWLVKVEAPMSAQDAATALRSLDTPIIGRISGEALYLDPRTVTGMFTDYGISAALARLSGIEI